MQIRKTKFRCHRLIGPMALAAIVLTVLTMFSGCADEATRADRHRARAEQFSSEGRYSEAVLELKNVIKIYPDDYDSYYQLAEIYIQMEEFILAAEAYAEAINTDPKKIAAHYKMGHIFLAAERPMEARKAARLIIDKDPDHIGAYQLLAAVQVQEHNVPAAIRTLHKAREIGPRQLMPNLFLAHLLAAEGRIDEAEVLYQEIISIHPTDSVAYLELSTLYGRNGRWEDARRLIARMALVTEIDFPRLANTARYFESQEQLQLAESLYVKGDEMALDNQTAPLMDLAAYYVRQGARFKALSVMQRALARKPDDATILTSIARLHMNSGDVQSAENAVDSALGNDPEHADAIQLKGEILFARQEHVQALNQFDLTITLDPDNYRAYFFKALCLSVKGVEIQPEIDLFRTAAGLHDDTKTWVDKLIEKNLRQALKLRPDLLKAKLMLADFYLRNGMRDEAREQINSALDLSPDRMETLTLLGSLRLMDGNLSGAETLCEEVLAKHPDLGNWHARLGIVYMRMRRSDDAIAAFRKALELNPEQLGTLKLLTDIHLSQKDFAAAIEETQRHKKRIEKIPIAAPAIDNLQGMIYMAWNKPEAARRQFGLAIAELPQYISPHMGLAVICRRENDQDGAIALYEAVLSINADYLPACMALGEIHYQRGDKKQAEAYYRRALDIQADFGPAANNLAYVLSFRDEKLPEAMELARMAKLKMPNNPSTKDTLGWILYRMGLYVDALQELELSLSLDPHRALTCYHLGLVYYRQGRFDAARGLFKRALELDPDFEGADDARTLLE